MKRYLLVTVGVLVGISYYQHTKVASLVGSKVQPLGPAAYRAATRTAAMTALGQRGLASALSQTAGNQSVPCVRFQSTLQPNFLANRFEKLYSSRVSPVPLGGGGIRTRMMSSQAVNPVDNDHKLQDALEAPDLNARVIEVAMLERAGIDPSKVRVEYGEEAGVNFDPGTNEEKYVVFCEPVITDDGAISPRNITLLAHEFMHIKLDHVRQFTQEKKKYNKRILSYYPAKDLTPEELELRKKFFEFLRQIEMEADIAAAQYYPDLKVAKYSWLHYKNCVERGRDRVVVKGDRSHPFDWQRAEYLEPFASEQEALAQRKAKFEAMHFSEKLGPTQKKFSKFEYIAGRYPPLGSATQLQLMQLKQKKQDKPKRSWFSRWWYGAKQTNKKGQD